MSFEGLSEDFAREALDLLERLERSLLSLEETEPGVARADQAAVVRRILHTIKGNAGLVGAGSLQAAIHTMEDAAVALIELDAPTDGLLSATEIVRAECWDILSGRSPSTPSQAIVALAEGLPRSSEVRIRLAPDEDVLVTQGVMDDMLAATSDLRVQNASLRGLRLVAEEDGDGRVRSTLDRLDGALNRLHELVLRVRTVRIGPFLGRFQRLVRDESRQQRKQVQLRRWGGDVEVDRAVLSQVSGALVHLVRNAVAHGIEMPADRRAAGKPERGTVSVTAHLQGSRLILIVEDDGRGLDVEAIAVRARELGLDATQPASVLIFEAGLSTAALSQSAGRGVGMDAVRRRVQRIGGTVEVTSERGRGTRFKITVPASVALQRALLCELAGEIYAIPALNVVEATALAEGGLRRLGQGEAVEHRGRLVTVVNAERVLGAEPRRGGYALILEAGRSAALRVDGLLGQHELIFQPIDLDVRGRGPVSGATLLADGRVVLRLDPDQLVQDADASREARA